MSPCSRKKRSSGLQTGFTLVELLVVIGIVAIMVGMLMPALSKARAQSQLVNCMSRERALTQALFIYAAGNKGSFPPNTSTPAPGTHWTDWGILGIRSDLAIANVDSAGYNVGTAFTCPADGTSARTYAMNYWASCAVAKPTTTAAKQQQAQRGIFWHQGSPGASSLVLLSETWTKYAITNSSLFYATDTIGYSADDPAARFGANGGESPAVSGPWGLVNCEVAYALHRRSTEWGGLDTAGLVNIAFADGHVSTVSLSSVVNSQGRLTGVAYWSPMDWSSASIHSMP